MSSPSEVPTNETSETKRTTLTIIKHWFLQSPSHGIRRINRADSLYARVFWSFIFLGFTTLMCTFIYTTIQKFITHPTKVNLSVRQDQQSHHYPAVTICNLNPLRNDKILDEFRSFPEKTTTNDSVLRNRFTDYIASILKEDYSSRSATFFETGYQLNDILIECKFNGRSCRRHFDPFFHPNYGNCYTFDNEKHVEPDRTTRMTHFWSIDDTDGNDGYKLSMELYLFQDEYLSYLDDRAAFRVFLHRKHEIPILSQTSLLLAPTVFTKLIFSHRQIFFSQDCRTNFTDDMKEMFGEGQWKYTQALCYKLCFFRHLQKECSCTDQWLIIFFQYFRPNQTLPFSINRSCSLTDSCVRKQKPFNSKKFCPSCLPECQLTQYTVHSSYADYPSIRSTEKVKQRVQRHLSRVRNVSRQNISTICSSTRRESLLENLVAVEISASPYATEILTESPMYTWVDLISSIGGQTGLWIGVSLISFVEIAELFFLLFSHWTRWIYYTLLVHGKRIYHRLFDRKMVTKM